MEYNTSRGSLLLMEYGRNVQKLAQHISSIEDKSLQTKYSHTLIQLMRQLNPTVKETTTDNPQRIWDHLHVMSDFKLEIESPYPKPSPESLEKKPEPMQYLDGEVRFKHYGRNIERMVKAAITFEIPEKQIEAAVQVGKMMRFFHSCYNKEVLDAKIIVAHLREMSKGELDLREIASANDNLFDIKEFSGNTPSSYSSNNSNTVTNSSRHKGRRGASTQKRRRSK